MSAFPAVHDRVKVLAGPHLGKLGEVYHVDESRMSPILVVGGDFRDWYRPDEVEKIPLPTVGDQVRITLGLFRGNRGTVERIDESLPSPILVAGERFAGWYEPDQVEAVPKCGCHLNDEGRGHWSACPEAEVSETEPGPTLAHLRQAEKAGLERGDSFTYIPGPEPVSETEPEETGAPARRRRFPKPSPRKSAPRS